VSDRHIENLYSPEKLVAEILNYVNAAVKNLSLEVVSALQHQWEINSLMILRLHQQHQALNTFIHSAASESTDGGFTETKFRLFRPESS